MKEKRGPFFMKHPV